MKPTRLMAFVDPCRWFLAGALALGLVACGGDGGGSQIVAAYTARLSGDQEVPPTVTGATGTGGLTLETPSNVVSGSITIEGMTATAAHIHVGDVGVNGPIIVTLTQTSPGVWAVPPGTSLTEAQVALLNAGGLYFNAHSTALPNGEIRGQIGREVFNVQLSPAQEVPPPTSTASGSGVLVLDPATRRFTASITVTGMNATAAHIHEAAPGVNGPIIFPLSQASTGSTTWVAAADATMTEAQLATLRAGGMYFNAHSPTFPGGEVRGQIGRHVSPVRLTGAQEVPPTGSAAVGTGMLVVDPATRGASGAFGLTGMTANAAHIHLAPAGVNGPIIVPLTNAGNVWSVPANTVLTPEQFLAYKQGNLYYNAHSTAFPGGEVRAQIRP
jgi:hypothetical protein